MGSHLQFPPRMEELRHMCEFVVTAAQEAGLGDQAIYHCEISVEEVCTNIIQHGFVEANNGYIDISTDQDAEHFIMVIADNSPAFNPLLYEDDEADPEARKMEPGGLGIVFLKKMMDGLSYQYRGGENRIILRKRLHGD
jgi:serine/threonine-protein kinase RsbW